MDDINNLDPRDEGLKAIFGARFHDSCEAVKAVPAAVPVKGIGTKTVIDAAWDEAEEAPAVQMRWKLLKALGFVGLNLLIFVWQQAGLMDAKIAVPSCWVCVAIAGFLMGQAARKGATL